MNYEISHIQKEKKQNCMISLICEILKVEYTEAESRMVCQEWGR